MLWIALHLPQLPLDTVLRSRLEHATPALASPSDAPIVITERKRIGWCNQAACEAGIRNGMSETNAWTLAAGLQVHARDPQQEERALHEAALWTLHFTPHVVLQPNGLLAEVAASLRLFKGFERLTTQLANGIAELGLQAQMANAPTAAGAWLLAQCSDADQPDQTIAGSTLTDLLDPIPLTVMSAAQRHLDTLLNIGCTTLGQLRRLPRTGLTRRFGKELLTAMDRAYGEEPEVHDWFEAPAVFDAKLELSARVESTQALLFAARRLLLQLTGWLSARQVAITKLTLWLHHESTKRRDHRSTAVDIVLASPSRDPDHLTLLLRERLAQVALIAPVIEISLAADQIVTLATSNCELFPTQASAAETVGRLIERLQSRLGVDAVRQLALFPDHRPEKSHVALPIVQQRNRTPALASHVTPTRPTWLLQQPLPLLTRQHKPFYQSPLTLLAGPERIEAGWWDDALAVRDYFIAENDGHALLWIFRIRSSAESSDAGWFLHGFFA